MTKFRKKPVVIEAWQTYVGGAMTQPQWLREAMRAGVVVFEPPSPADGNRVGIYKIKTLEGEMTAEPRDWIIQGVQGELYPCKPDIFAATYEPVEDADAQTD